VLYQVYLRSFADADGPLGECPDPLTLAADEGVVVGPDR
jgi:hypothetical protein